MTTKTKKKPDTVADLVTRLNDTVQQLSENGTEVSLSIQRVPVCYWRHLRPIVKASVKPGRPV